MEKIRTAQGKNAAFTYAKIFVDFFANTTGEPEEEATNFIRKYFEEWNRLNTQTHKYFIEWLEAWNFHKYARIFEAAGYNIKENIIAYNTAERLELLEIKKGGLKMIIKKYIDKDGNERKYMYDDRKYNKKYNKKRNHEIYKLQKRKSYYKKKGDLEKVKTLDILIKIEKRRMKIEKKETQAQPF